MKTLIVSAFLLALLSATVTTFATEIPPGPVSGDWTSSGNPYNINGDVYINAGEALTIHEGVLVRFCGLYSLAVDGKLEVLGVAGDSVYFYPSSIPTGWNGIRFGASADTNQLNYCVIRNAQSTGIYSSNMSWQCLIYINHSSIRSNTGGGIAGDNTALVMNDCDVCNNSGSGINGNMGFWLTINNCNICGNTSTFPGGGIYQYCGGLHATNCLIAENTGSGGGGYFSTHGGAITFDNCTISGNNASTMGGGFYIIYDSNPVLSHCTITQNTTSSSGVGGGFYSKESYPHLDHCTIDHNSAGNGGGIYCYLNTGFDLINCDLIANTAYGNGGAVYLAVAGDINLKNTIVAGNAGNGGVYFGHEFTVSSISYGDFWNNNGGNFAGINVPGGLGVLSTINANGDSCDAYHNILLDPLFVNSGWDYHLSYGSPCIDAGDPTSPLDPDNTVTDIGVYYFNQNYDVSVTLVPVSSPVVIPASGGSFFYYLFAENNEAFALPYDLWISVVLPDSSTISPLLGPAHLTLNPGTTGWYRVQNVPAHAPAGYYDYIAHLGTYPNTVNSADTIQFVKIGARGWGLETGGWTNTGEDFDGGTRSVVSLSGSGATPTMKTSPNPFNPTTVISYKLQAASHVSLRIYDTAGRLVATLVDGWRDAGMHEVTFDASGLASGVYLCRLVAGDYSAVRKLVLMK